MARPRRDKAPPPPPGVPLFIHCLAFSILALAVVLAYLPVMRGEFQFDDAMGIERGGWLLNEGKEREEILKTLGHWSDRGLVVATYQLNYWMAGGNKVRQSSLNAVADSGTLSAPFHAFNIGFHLIAAGGLYAILAWMTRRLGRPDWLIPALGAALFGLHPLATEGVAYISARSGAMAAGFGLWGIAGLLAFGGPGPDGRPQPLWSRTLGVSLLGLGTLLAVGCKETGWMIPFMGLGALAWAYLGDRRALWRDWGLGLMAGGVAFGLGMLAWLQGRQILGQGALQQYAGAYGLPPSEAVFAHAATQLHLWWATHLPRFLLPLGPWHLSVDLAPSVLKGLGGSTAALVALEILACLAGAAWAWKRQKSPAALGLAWIVLAVVPVSFAALLDVTTERHAYMPLACVALGLAPLLAGLARRRDTAAGVALALACLAWFTLERTGQWSTEQALWGAAVRDAPQKARPHYNLAKARLQLSLKMAQADPERSRRIGKASEHGLRRTLRAAAGFHLAHGALARELQRQGRLEEAASSYRMALICHAEAYGRGEARDMHAGQVTALAVEFANCLRGLRKDEEAAKALDGGIAFHVKALREQVGPAQLHREHAVGLILLLARLHAEGGRAAQARQVLRDWLRAFQGDAKLAAMLKSLETPVP